MELGQSLFAGNSKDDEELRTQRVSAWCHRLKQEGGIRIVQLLQKLDTSDFFSAQRTDHATCLRYFQNHQHKMDYPRYVKNGWQIGSGPVESACKTVVGGRLKQAGMRWGEGRLRRRLPPPRPLPQSARPMGRILEKPPQLTHLLS